jgi:hypothetical protein
MTLPQEKHRTGIIIVDLIMYMCVRWLTHRQRFGISDLIIINEGSVLSVEATSYNNAKKE